MKLYNLQDYTHPTTFTITRSKDKSRNIEFMSEMPVGLQRWKIDITSRDHLALLQYLLMVRRNKFKVDLWFDGPKAEARRRGLPERLRQASRQGAGVLSKQPIYKDYR